MPGEKKASVRNRKQDVKRKRRASRSANSPGAGSRVASKASVKKRATRASRGGAAAQPRSTGRTGGKRMAAKKSPKKKRA
jgi:hypothetical protein